MLLVSRPIGSADQPISSKFHRSWAAVRVILSKDAQFIWSLQLVHMIYIRGNGGRHVHR